MIDFLSDLSVFFADFGEPQTWLPQTSLDRIPVTGIFENDYDELSLQIGTIGTPRPALIVKTANIAGLARGDGMIITAVLYGIAEVDYTVETRKDSPPDLGPGLTRLILKKA